MKLFEWLMPRSRKDLITTFLCILLYSTYSSYSQWDRLQDDGGARSIHTLKTGDLVVHRLASDDFTRIKEAAFGEPVALSNSKRFYKWDGWNSEEYIPVGDWYVNVRINGEGPFAERYIYTSDYDSRAFFKQILPLLVGCVLCVLWMLGSSGCKTVKKQSSGPIVY